MAPTAPGRSGQGTPRCSVAQVRQQLHLPADVLNAPFTLLPELHVSLNGLLQVQDCGVLHHNHSCGRRAMLGSTATASGGRKGTRSSVQTVLDGGSNSGGVGSWLPRCPSTYMAPEFPLSSHGSVLSACDSLDRKVRRERESTYALSLHPSCTRGLSSLGHILVLSGN